MTITRWFEVDDPNFGDDSNSTVAQRAASIANLPPNTYRVATDNKATTYRWLRRLNDAVLEGGAVAKFSCVRELRDGVLWFSFEFTLIEGKCFILPH